MHPGLINDEGWEAVGSRSTFEKRMKAKKPLRNFRQAVKAQSIKETKLETEPAPREKALAKSSEPMRKPITLTNFLLSITEEEDELQILNCNQISRVGRPPFSDLEDSNDDWAPLTMPPPMDDDYQDID